jgi:hypothetical protein
VWEIIGIPILEIAQHEILHGLYSLAFLLVIYFVSWMTFFRGQSVGRLLGSITNYFLLLGLLVCAVLVSHYFADEIWVIKPMWVNR